jgi:hypothetical protein
MRIEPHVVIRKSVQNQSSRHGAQIQLFVVHSTAGANIPNSIRDLAGVVNWFDTPSSDASSNVIVDSDAQSARCVEDAAKAWAQAYYNPWCLSVEQIGQGDKHVISRAELQETARWLALWHSRYPHVPLHKGSVSKDGRILKNGVLRHSELGNLGGGHPLCPGSGMDLSYCLDYARRIASR